ncbi:MAG: UbiA-like polyprenyltransferase [Ginsengibacter sp.]
MNYKIKNYLSLVKFAHTIFAMPFALIGFFLGSYWYPAEKMRIEALKTHNSLSIYITPSWKLLGLIILCMVFARSAAMAFNRWLDKKFDALNPRTAIREIPAGIISEKNALIFIVVNCIAFIICTFFINTICFALSPVALFVILFYSYTKRFTALSHLVLGLGLSLAPIGAYLAITGMFDLLPLLFSFTVLFWVSGFDIIYALQDEEFDKANNLFSIPSVLGKVNALRVSEALHFLSTICVIAAGFYGHLGWIYWIGVGFFILLLIYQHTLVKPDNLSKVNLAFFTTNGIASVIFCTFVIADLFINNHPYLLGN